MKLARWSLLGWPLLLVSGPALASDFTGLLSALVFVGFVGPWTLVCLLVFAVRAIGGRYKDRDVARRHSLVGAIGPTIGLLVALLDFRVDGNLLLALVILAVAFAATSLPMIVHTAREHV